MEIFRLEAKPRKILGKKVRRLRKEGILPAILYGHDIKPEPVLVKKTDFEKVYEVAGSSNIIKLSLDNKTLNVLAHEPDLHPVTGLPIHVDFYQVKMDEKIKTEIPLKFIGESKAVKELDGTLVINKDAIEVECLPKDLVSEIEVDTSPLQTFDDLIHIRDLKVPAGIEVLEEEDEVVASVESPRSEEELKELEEAPEEEEKEALEKMEVEEETEKTSEEEEKEGKTKEEAPKEGEAKESPQKEK